ncbi:hypothetical protein CLV92_103363 [Kineococcus xinjiangensis]|uniref:LysM domain-containing protein n=1 Tax=Kineococcus xinjiangensis TaxID=512762 RepID=A0A2S6IUC9_9ACTN|nr:LysM domain-containing protein [Kineococcus xinjiangensis]PPK97828.1 hypothetical protein CLV92_103363 [Kineococcus xinjiangensis]
MGKLSHQLRGLAAAAVLTAVPLALAGGALAVGAPALRAAAAGGARPEDMLVAACAMACAAVLAWLAVAVAASAAVDLRGARPGGPLARWEDRTSPAALRRLVAAAIGIAVGAGAATSHAAAPAEPGWAVVTTATAEEPTVVGTAPTATATTTAPAPGPGWAGAERAAQASRPGPDGGSIVVHRGDTLWDLVAAHLGAGSGTAPEARRVAAEVQRWWALNRTVIGEDPDVLRPGQVLRVPAVP